jgi:hypothetical protein
MTGCHNGGAGDAGDGGTERTRGRPAGGPYRIVAREMALWGRGGGQVGTHKGGPYRRGGDAEAGGEGDVGMM